MISRAHCNSEYVMKIWAVANQKGGVGKTTTAVTLAGLLSRFGKRVLLVDLDPHGSMSAYFGVDPDDISDSVYHLFQRSAGGAHTPLASLMIRTRFDGVSLLPASSALATLDRQLAGKDGMGLVIANALAQCENQFDYVLLDCPPVMGVLMVNALAACSELLIPVQTEFLALKGLDRMLHTLQMIQKSGLTSMTYHIVPTMYDKRTRASRETLQRLRDNYGQHLWPGVIPVDTRFREASRSGIPLSVMSPGSRGSMTYQKLLEYIETDKSIPDNVHPIRSLA